MFIRSTSFQHMNIHPGTLMRWGTNGINQIDYVLVLLRHYSPVRSCLGPNCDLDYLLVKTYITGKLSTTPRKNQARAIKWNTAVLKKDPLCAAEYKRALKNKTEANDRG